MESSDRHELYLRLLTKYERRLRLYVQTLVPMRTDVDDILQDTTILLWKKFEEFDSSRSFLTWASKFAYFEVLKYRQRQAKKKKIFSDELVELLADEKQAHQSQFEHQEKALKECMGNLTQQDRELIQLRYGAAASITELAEEIEQPVARLYRNLARIRRVLASCINKNIALQGGN